LRINDAVHFRRDDSNASQCQSRDADPATEKLLYRKGFHKGLLVLRTKPSLGEHVVFDDGTWEPINGERFSVMTNGKDA